MVNFKQVWTCTIWAVIAFGPSLALLTVASNFDDGTVTCQSACGHGVANGKLAQIYND
jgi:hypothetical protein